jgi:hypothetical protein
VDTPRTADPPPVAFAAGAGAPLQFRTRLALGLDYKDTQCGFKAFRRNAAQTIFSLQKIERWGFDPEILFLARQAGFKVAEVPVRWAHDDRSRINPVADGLRMAMEVLAVRWYALPGKYADRTNWVRPCRWPRASKHQQNDAPTLQVFP